ncbi:hypothetical protein [Kitasatospora sp. MAA19]|uniref:hypothetical protein n=1 Tax=Kitasatospora sp. MAA19 TaxID=3035090 RepID=UPI002476553A|nr:hypothetical protein [Kitasatospora sp. MAA19]
MSANTGAAIPRTTWEHCLSAADQLVLRQPLAGREQQEQVVVLLAAVLAGCADSAGLTGSRVAEAPLDGLAGLLDAGARIAVRVCPAPPGLGGEQREALLALDRSGFRDVQAAAREVLAAHLADAGARARTVRAAAGAAHRARVLHGAARALGIDEEG